MGHKKLYTMMEILLDQGIQDKFFFRNLKLNNQVHFDVQGFDQWYNHIVGNWSIIEKKKINKCITKKRKRKKKDLHI